VLTFKIAETINDYIEAWSIVYERYLMLKLIDPNPYGIWVFPEYLCKKSITLLAYEKQSLIATVSGVWSEKLPLDEYYPEELNKLRTKHNTIVEGGLIAKRSAGISQNYVVQMIDVFYSLLYDPLNLCKIVIGLHPNASAIYEERYNYKIMGTDKIYTILRNAPVRLLHSDLSKFKKVTDVEEYQFPNCRNKLDLSQNLVQKESRLTGFLNHTFTNESLFFN